MSTIQDHGYFSGGQWKQSSGNTSFDVFEPYSGKLMSHVANCGAEEANTAIEAAQQAFPAWAAMPPAKKAALFLKAAAIYRQRSEEIADILSRETGSTISFARFQQSLVVQNLEAAAGWIYNPKGETFPSDVTGRLSFSIRRPLGVIACFTPWNGANILSWRAALGPLAAGNTVIIKPSEFAPVSAGLMVARITEEAGFPAGVINVVPHAPGGAGAISDAVFASAHVRGINLIGGVQTARILAERAGRTLKRTVLELGGYNPLIVLDDVDVDFAVRTATFGAFFHQGQICMNTRKIIIARKLHDEFLEKFVQRARKLPMGDPSNPATLIGPLINKAAIEKVHKGVQEAVAMGARIETGGTFEGQVYQPTILTNVPYEATISNEETFGPVVIVEPVDSVEDAVRVANRTAYGLVASILSGDTYRGLELAPRIQAGVVNVNTATVNDEAHVPMGGVRDSGWGRTGPDCMNDFTDTIWINARHSKNEEQYPF
ncbi:acyl-CoA reductase-like NAD-dependent aldehyde dehydrogenase [Xanthomonas arboricola]|uniref:aldehyde dehydrogenase family protein n=1 Tax=Xanthomonas sp. 3793 TaxID=3035312 RepID=UPI00216A615D|nr:aldehyde dehydrogenase family protein [Xanthomonas sp. 3793]MCS3747906.1 acyl-CoA reductase-like NAD-dependent aldehyde dehydrogenase [Xanthomonas sp. 3793]